LCRNANDGKWPMVSASNVQLGGDKGRWYHQSKQRGNWKEHRNWIGEAAIPIQSYFHPSPIDDVDGVDPPKESVSANQRVGGRPLEKGKKKMQLEPIDLKKWRENEKGDDGNWDQNGI
jgi:hypothetical protein